MLIIKSGENPINIREVYPTTSFPDVWGNADYDQFLEYSGYTRYIQPEITENVERYYVVTKFQFRCALFLDGKLQLVEEWVKLQNPIIQQAWECITEINENTDIIRYAANELGLKNDIKRLFQIAQGININDISTFQKINE